MAHLGSAAGANDPDPQGLRRHLLAASQSVNFTFGGFDTQLIPVSSSTITWTNYLTRSNITGSYQLALNDSNHVINEGATS